jgi:formylglycine-generating enzyme required for sulfatase activity
MKEKSRQVWGRNFFLGLLFSLLPACAFSILHPGPRTLDPPAGMVLIPAGDFLMGSKPSDGAVGIQIGVDELPQEHVYLNSFFIDRYEVTNAQYYVYVQATGAYRPATWDPSQHPLGKKGVVWPYGTPAPGENNYPVTDTDWYDAKAYCHWADKRLPTEAEWEKAARGTDGRQFPWGNDVDSSKANTQESGLRWARPVGSYPEDVSPYGVYDMIGNVAEWVDDWYHPYPGSTLKRGAFGHYPVLRGGSWATPVYPFGRVAARLPFEQLPPRSRSDHWHTGFDKGFRCAKDVK